MHIATPPAPCPPSTAHLALPFFDDAHRTLAEGLVPWAAAQEVDETDDRAACRDWVKRLGAGGWLRYCVPAAHGGALPALDSRALVLLRETLAYHSPLADFAFAMQGLGSGAITLAGSSAQQAHYLQGVARGELIAAFALSEPEAGSDVGAMQTIARSAYPSSASGQNDHRSTFSLTGTKTWISNGGIADFYCVFAKTEPTGGTRGISAFIVDANTPGLDASRHIHVMAPHPLATLQFDNCTVPATALLGEENGGFKLAMRTLDIFRASVAAAALGMARRALAEAVHHARQRRMFGQTLADFQLTQAKIGEMAALVDSAALLTYRAAWLRDEGEKRGGTRVTAEAAMAKMTATENAQRVIDMALQLHGGRGVEVGSKVESLYRDIRSLRIYEGATEVQQLIIGKAVLQE
ncbi:MAG: acyl-CoA dehydrogenase family protein [Gammaproteobacteria bacterium]|nr:acyl-CoA dehydrogenase family protein [Gammaproteobacteria bacterium]MBU1507204.1 acyl-CoA dehydrogenase family protein [Gammaproteobacteria bacterium]MBU2121272.1 acyl-CoA dehydrogenase family protein [Gammaproteobacteria bacterium]MBU2171035.1 acyl-CoA dehydrogenase family protein [Gammaproteobacteria bacterium]MBU2201653.1 acyl-CoA dehydrogenase family protein [Gammaproteobacteria bacterium]